MIKSYNPDTFTLLVEMEMIDISELAARQTALMRLIQNFDYSPGQEYIKDTIYYALDLLADITLSSEQQQNGLTNDEQYIKLPRQASPEKVQAVRELITALCVENTGIDPRRCLDNFLQTT